MPFKPQIKLLVASHFIGIEREAEYVEIARRVSGVSDPMAAAELFPRSVTQTEE